MHITLKKAVTCLVLGTIALTVASCGRSKQGYSADDASGPQGGLHSYSGEPAPLNAQQPHDLNNEEYSSIAENEFHDAKFNPISTFSIDVDSASYSNVRRFINDGQPPPKDAVRIEEMINYFKYDYPQPQGEHPFSVHTEIARCPWNTEHRLVHIGLQGRRVAEEDMPPSNLVFLIDVSGSMDQPEKLPLLKSALNGLVNGLRDVDQVAIVVYAGSAGMVLPSTSGDRKEDMLAAIEKLTAGGSTNGGEGINLAYQIARHNFIENGNNRVILATDGDFNVGVSSDAELVSLIEQKRNEKIFLTVLGFGRGNLKDSRMEQIADKGNGQYAYIDSLEEARKVLVRERGGTLYTIAKDVKIQVEFNPANVEAYRLIGYENRLLRAEDFNDDTKDAGELGAGHTVTALYEVVPSGAATRVSVDPLRYRTTEIRAQGETGNELMTVKLRYKAPQEEVTRLIAQSVIDRDADIAQASDNLRFSAAVAEFGLLLKDSRFKGQATYKTCVALARKARGADLDGYRAEFIKLVEQGEALARLAD